MAHETVDRINFREVIFRKIYLIMIFIGLCFYLPAQNLDYVSKKTVLLSDGSSITLYAQLDGNGGSAKPGKNYYYLPTQVMLAKNPETQVPQFLFLKYVTEEREDQGGVSGALLHFLVQWGMTPAQLEELKGKMNSDIPGAVVKGPVDLFPADGESYVITSATVNASSGMTKSIVTSGKAPLVEGGKLAVASNLNKIGAQLLAATFEKSSSVTDISVTMNYKYYLKVNGLKATITIDYEKISTLIKEDKVTAEYRKVESKNETQESQSWSEMHNVFDKLIEKSAVKVDIQQGIPNAISDKLTEIVFQILLEKLTKPADDKVATGPPAEKEKQYLPGKNDAYGYYLDVKTIQNSIKKKRDVIYINYDYMLPMPGQATGNLASWYSSVKDNKNCIASVNLNDPFYKHLDIRFILDLEAKEMFDMEVNYVTVNVRKKRNSGNDFTDRVTIDKKYVTDKGIAAIMTYAGGEDNNPDIYQYATQWSLRGGNVFPATPVWEKGELEAVTLKPPITPRTIEFETDIEKLKGASISRVTLQVRFKKFGEEVEENINLSAGKSESLISKMLFMDRDTRGYVYRLIFNHTTEGKLALPWSSKVNDNYVYAIVPDELKDKNSELFQRAIEAAKKIAATGTGGKVTVDKVLDDFKEVLGVVKPGGGH